MNTIENIRKKYIVDSTEDSIPRVNRNLQAEINKIESIKNLIKNKAVSKSELNRLESSVLSLYKVIKDRHG